VVFFVAFLPELWGRNWLLALFGMSRFETSLDKAALNYGMVPYYVLRSERLYTLFTSIFMHADILHLGGNMLFLHVFGDNVEDAFGHGRYLFFYLLAGIVASATHIMAVLYSVQVLHSAPFQALQIPAVGASGAIAGVLGAYILLYPKARILTLILFWWVFITAIPAIYFLGVWFFYQLLYGMLALELPIGIAYWAHIGGFVTGVFFGFVWRKRKRIETY